MKLKKLRRQSYKLHTDYSPIHKVYYNSVKFHRENLQMKQRVLAVRKEIIGR